MNQVLQQLGLLGIVPVIAIEDAGQAEPLAQALIDGGLPCAEVTFRTDAAQRSIERMAKAFPSMLVGAGTVLSVDQAKRAVDSGARFIVSPGLNRSVVEYCVKRGVPVTPGVLTPTEIQAALELGLDVVKFFPAVASGGIEYLKAISAPYRQVWFIPTGGLTESNFVNYLKAPGVFACGGSWMVKTDLISAGKFDVVSELSRRAVGKMLDFRLCRPGNDDLVAGGAEKIVVELERIFHIPFGGRGSLAVAGTQAEFPEAQRAGLQGGIVVTTNFIERAVEYCARNGIGVKNGTSTEKNRRLVSVHLDLEVDGCAVQLLQSE